MEQMKFDILRFSELLAKFTGISKSKIDAYLNDRPVNSIFEHTASLNITKSQQAKLEDMRELRNLYDNLKISENKMYVMNSSTKAGEYFRNYFNGFKEREKFVCAFLDAQNRIISTKVMFEGTVNEAPVYVREIVKEAVFNDANSVILAHNHPGGTSNPSTADIEVTRKIRNALNTVNIDVADHIIATGESYTSMAERGCLLAEDKSNFTVGKMVSEAISEKEFIISKMSKEYPAIKYITENTAHKLYNMYVSSSDDGRFLTRGKITELYKQMGYKLENMGSRISEAAELNAFKELESIVLDFKNCDLKYKEEVSMSKKRDVQPVKNKGIENEV
jgi:DNA repair protein RadC